MIPEQAARALREAVEAHQPESGWLQWYADELVIDCDAGEFWRVVERALEGLT